MSRVMDKTGRMVWGDNGLARLPTQEYKDNFDRIFRKKKIEEETVDESKQVSRIECRGQVPPVS